MNLRTRFIAVVGLLYLFALSMATSAPAQVRLRDRLRERFAQSERPHSQLRSDAQFLKIAGLDIAIWYPKHAHGPAPLVVFSHGYLGINVQSEPLMRALSEAGYLVIAPNHNDAFTNKGGAGRPQQPLGKPDQWNEKTYRDRGKDIENLIAALENDPDWSTKIDWSKVAFVGHSLGGYTVLALAGAWPEWKMSGIKAVVALSPYSHPFNVKGNLADLNVPVMYQTGTTDIGVAPFLKGPNGAFSKTSSPAYMVEFRDANHFTWTNLNKEKQKEDLINYYCVSFLDKFVKGDPAANPQARLNGVTALLVK